MLRTGDELAAMRPELLRSAMLRLRNRERAEDAVQKTLLAALEGVGRFAGAASSRTWAGAILKHEIADCLRAAGREEPMDLEERELPGSDPHESYARSRFFHAVEGASSACLAAPRGCSRQRGWVPHEI